MISCSKESNEPEVQNDCLFTEELTEIVPFCTWPPQENHALPLPVGAMYNGAHLSHEEYHFEWSSDLDFGSGQISIKYTDLPVTVTITEIATGCVVVETLTAE